MPPVPLRCVRSWTVMLLISADGERQDSSRHRGACAHRGCVGACESSVRRSGRKKRGEGSLHLSGSSPLAAVTCPESRFTSRGIGFVSTCRLSLEIKHTVFKEQSPGGFPTSLLDLSSNRTFRISCYFPKGSVSLS